MGFPLLLKTYPVLRKYVKRLGIGKVRTLINLGNVFIRLVVSKLAMMLRLGPILVSMQEQ